MKRSGNYERDPKRQIPYTLVSGKEMDTEWKENGEIMEKELRDNVEIIER